MAPLLEELGRRKFRYATAMNSTPVRHSLGAAFLRSVAVVPSLNIGARLIISVMDEEMGCGGGRKFGNLAVGSDFRR